MNYTTAKCGHPTPAVGAPNSEARKTAENNACDACHLTSQDLLDAMRGDLMRFSSDALEQFWELSKLCLPSATDRFRDAMVTKEGIEAYDDYLDRLEAERDRQDLIHGRL